MDWLLGDRKTGEIEQIELGLRAHQLWKTKDGVLAERQAGEVG